jgi:hypothetical protein
MPMVSEICSLEIGEENCVHHSCRGKLCFQIRIFRSFRLLFSDLHIWSLTLSNSRFSEKS